MKFNQSQVISYCLFVDASICFVRERHVTDTDAPVHRHIDAPIQGYTITATDVVSIVVAQQRALLLMSCYSRSLVLW